MLTDARSIDDGAELIADVCVCGSGPAGLAVVSRLAGRGLRVVLMESGGVEPDPALQTLSEADVVGDALDPPSETRHRQLGGNAHRWYVRLADGDTGLRLVTLDDVDLEPRGDGLRHGWPISSSTLARYYERAALWFGAGSLGPDLASPPSGNPPAGPAPWALDPTIARSRVFRFGRSRELLGGKLGAFFSDPHVHVFHHATAVSLVQKAAGRPVERVRFRHPDGRGFTVAARHVVLALGGIENARLLLASNEAEPAGLGNGHDLVGRYFMDHPMIPGGLLVPSRPDVIGRSGFYDLRDVHGHSVMGFVSLTDEVLRERGLPNLSASFFPRPSRRRAVGAAAFQELLDAARGRHVDRTALRAAARAVGGLDYVVPAAARSMRTGVPVLSTFGAGGWSRSGRPAAFRSFEVAHQAEQLPDRDNRVTLTDVRDALGTPKAKVSWRWTRRDAEGVAESRRLLAEALETAGVGRVELPDPSFVPEDRPSGGTAHHIGTTRMADDPAAGVVDRNGRVHGVRNVFVAGSSVFPSGGFANPTLTIAALALRLGDYLASLFDSGLL